MINSINLVGCHDHKIGYKDDVFDQKHQKFKMKLLPLLFRYIFQGNAGHIVKRAGPISQTNICIKEYTVVSDDRTNFSNKGIKIDDNVF